MDGVTRVAILGMLAASGLAGGGCESPRPLAPEARGGPDARPGPGRAPGPGDAGTGAAPVFGGEEPVLAASPPPPLQGGTLLVVRDGRFAIAADPDRDVVHRVDLGAREPLAPVRLPAGAEPGRLTEDGSGRIHVALRQGGAVWTFDPATGEVLGSRAPCPAPSGLGWRPSTDEVLVACTDGTLVTYPADPERSEVPLEARSLLPDLRDVVVFDSSERSDRVAVTRFRSAELLVLSDEDGSYERFPMPDGSGDTALVAWRAVAHPQGGLVVLHQRQSDIELPALSNQYYAPRLAAAQLTYYPAMLPVADGWGGLFVDVAVHDTARVAVANGGVRATATTPEIRGTTSPDDQRSLFFLVSDAPGNVAVAYGPDGTLWAQRRDPPALVDDAGGPPILLADAAVADTGYDLFHLVTPSGLACASCHPGGADDGHVWNFGDPGPRRTPSLRGPMTGTEPFHWDGDMPTFDDLVDLTMVERMQLPGITAPQVNALARYVDSVPYRPSAPLEGDPGAMAGRDVFEAQGCATCHSGERLTNDETVDTPAGSLQVPPLRDLAARAPYLHDGTAATVREALAGHEGFDALTAADQAALIAYLDAL